MKHTITITIDVPAGTESAVHHAAYSAIELLNAKTQENASWVHENVRLFGYVAAGQTLPPVVQDVIDRLNEHVKRNRAAAEIVMVALSEITHAMSEADSQWRREQSAIKPSEEQEPT